jgi:NADH-quinone oxidoreductase subunit J
LTSFSSIDFAALRAELASYVPLAALIGIVLLMQLVIAFGVWDVAEGVVVAEGLATIAVPAEINTAALGLVLYDDYFLIFQLSGLILLVAMIGAIALTLRHRKDVKRQNVLHQMWRDPAKAMKVQDVEPGQGL